MFLRCSFVLKNMCKTRYRNDMLLCILTAPEKGIISYLRYQGFLVRGNVQRFGDGEVGVPLLHHVDNNPKEGLPGVLNLTVPKERNEQLWGPP